MDDETKQYLQSMEQRIIESLTEKYLPAMEQRIIESVEQRIIENLTEKYLPAMEQRIIENLTEKIRDMQTELLRGFQSFSTAHNVRMRKLEADQSNLNTALSQRMDVMEDRMLPIGSRFRTGGAGKG